MNYSAQCAIIMGQYVKCILTVIPLFLNRRSSSQGFHLFVWKSLPPLPHPPVPERVFPWPSAVLGPGPTEPSPHRGLSLAGPRHSFAVVSPRVSSHSCGSHGQAGNLGQSTFQGPSQRPRPGASLGDMLPIPPITGLSRGWLCEAAAPPGCLGPHDP